VLGSGSQTDMARYAVGRIQMPPLYPRCPLWATETVSFTTPLTDSGVQSGDGAIMTLADGPRNGRSAKITKVCDGGDRVGHRCGRCGRTLLDYPVCRDPT
jgi:hypothetical protein